MVAYPGGDISPEAKKRLRAYIKRQEKKAKSMAACYLGMAKINVSATGDVEIIRTRESVGHE